MKRAALRVVLVLMFGLVAQAFGASSGTVERLPSLLSRDFEEWNTLLVEALQEDLYTTANLALRQIAALEDQHPGRFAMLTCVGSEVVRSERLHETRLSYFVAEAADSDDQQSAPRPFLPTKLAIDTQFSSSCVPLDVIDLPALYEAPKVSTTRRVVAAPEWDHGVAEYAKQSLAERLGSSDWRVTHMKEETTKVSFKTSDFIVGLLQLPSERYLVVVYSNAASAPRTLSERRVLVNLADSHGHNEHQITVSHSSSSSSLHHERTSPAYQISQFSSLSPPRSSNVAKARRAAEPNSIKLMTYNIWNYNADWQERKQMLAQFIAAQTPDVVGVQEIRKRYSGGPDQLTELVDQLRQLNQSYYYIYQPAMYYDTEAEGVGVLSRWPIMDHEYINLTFVPGTPDGNRRIVLRTLLRNPATNKPFNFFVSHFTYAKGEGQMSNAYELFNFMKRQRPDVPQSVVADFNIYVGHEEPTNFLTGKLSYRGVRGDLTDVWEHAHGNDDPGYTFSNLPWSTGLINRADRVMVRNMLHLLTEPNSTITTGQVKPGGDPASDHLAVVSNVSYTTTAA